MGAWIDDVSGNDVDFLVDLVQESSLLLHFVCLRLPTEEFGHLLCGLVQVPLPILNRYTQLIVRRGHVLCEVDEIGVVGDELLGVLQGFLPIPDQSLPELLSIVCDGHLHELLIYLVPFVPLLFECDQFGVWLRQQIDLVLNFGNSPLSGGDQALLKFGGFGSGGGCKELTCKSVH